MVKSKNTNLLIMKIKIIRQEMAAIVSFLNNLPPSHAFCSSAFATSFHCLKQIIASPQSAPQSPYLLTLSEPIDPIMLQKDTLPLLLLHQMQLHHHLENISTVFSTSLPLIFSSCGSNYQFDTVTLNSTVV